MNPFKMQAALENGVALARLSWEVVRVRGADRLRWLHLLCSQALDNSAPAHGTVGLDTPARRAHAQTGVQLNASDAPGSAAREKLAPKSGVNTPLAAQTNAASVPVAPHLPPAKEALILDVRGRVKHWFLCSDDGQSSYLLTSPGAGAALAAHLESMRFLFEVQVETLAWQVLAWKDTSHGVICADYPGPHALWRDPWPGVCEGGTTYFRGTHHAGEGFGFIYAAVPPAEENQFVAAWQKQVTAAHTWPVAADTGELFTHPELVDETAYEALRLASWRITGADCAALDWALPHELDWLRTAVHLRKGCYCGQESVARIVNLGLPPRRLVFLQIDGSANLFPPRGAQVCARREAGDWEETGTLLAFASHHELGPVGLAVVRRTLDPTRPLKLTWTEPARAEKASVEAETAPEAVEGIPRELAVQAEPIVDPEGVSEAGGARYRRQAVAAAGIPQRGERKSLF